MHGVPQGPLSCGLAGERAVRNDELIVNAAEPDPGELVARPADRDGAVRTPAALVAVALGDRLDVKHIAARRTDARQLSDAIDLGIIGLASGGGEGERDAVFRLAATIASRPAAAFRNGLCGTVQVPSTKCVEPKSPPQIIPKTPGRELDRSRFGPQQALKTPRLSPQAAEPAFPRVPATALLDRFGGGQGTVAGGRVR